VWRVVKQTGLARHAENREQPNWPAMRKNAKADNQKSVATVGNTQFEETRIEFGFAV
jgi:hypothetical protein